jgi:hypothetical protein
LRMRVMPSAFLPLMLLVLRVLQQKWDRESF